MEGAGEGAGEGGGGVSAPYKNVIINVARRASSVTDRRFFGVGSKK